MSHIFLILSHGLSIVLSSTMNKVRGKKGGMQEKRKKICVFRVRQAIDRHPEGRKQEIGPETGALQDTCTARVECKCRS
jgi:hypothetical protein